MRTYIVLDDDLVKRAQELTGIHTKRELIHTVLCILVRLKEQAAARELRGSLCWEGDLSAVREEATDAGG